VLENAGTTQGQDAFSRIERRLNEYLSRVASLVLLAVWNHLDRLLLDIALRRLFAASDPQRQRRLVQSLALILYPRGHAIHAALLRPESTLDDIARGLHRAVFRVLLLLRPLS